MIASADTRALLDDIEHAPAALVGQSLENGIHFAII